MMPHELYWDLAQTIHEERLGEAQARRAKMQYEASLAARPRRRPRVTGQFRTAIAQALHRLAASINAQWSHAGGH